MIDSDSADREAPAVEFPQLQRIVEKISDAVVTTTCSGTITSWNPGAETLYRRAAGATLGMSISEAVGAAVDLAALAQTGATVAATHVDAIGAAVPVRVSAVATADGYVLICSNRTESSIAARYSRMVVDALAEGIVVFDTTGAIALSNPAALRLFGLDADGVPTDHAHRFRTVVLHDENGEPLAPQDRPIMQTLRTGESVRDRVFGIDRPDGSRVWMSGGTCLLRSDDGGDRAVLLSVTDVTAQRASTESLAYRAHHDHLTGLPNRAYILELLAHARRPVDDGGVAAVCYVDLHGLKAINDSMGHHAGDIAIQRVAKLLRTALRQDDIVGRLGGDEFVALLCGRATRSDIEAVTTGVHAALSQPLLIEGELCQVSASVGITLVPEDDPRTATELLRDADQAMYQAKAAGSGRSGFFGPEPGIAEPNAY